MLVAMGAPSLCLCCYLGQQSLLLRSTNTRHNSVSRTTPPRAKLAHDPTAVYLCVWLQELL